MRVDIRKIGIRNRMCSIDDCEEIKSVANDMKLDTTKLTINDATHLLKCRHAIGKSGRTYFMKCIKLSYTKSGKVKILVFGDRYWHGRNDIKKIRYVNDYDLKKI